MWCSVHKGRIRGKAHRWNNRFMCGRCYRYFTRNVRVIRVPRRRPQTHRRSLIERLKSLFG